MTQKSHTHVNNLNINAFSMMELLVVVTIISILAAISVPLYQGYIRDTRTGVLLQNIHGLRLFQEDLRIRTGQYGAGIHDLSDPDNPITTLTAVTGWKPPDSDNVIYQVSVTENSYTVTAIAADGTMISRSFP